MFYFGDGRKYEVIYIVKGDWENDLKHGKGTYIWPEGDVYEVIDSNIGELVLR